MQRNNKKLKEVRISEKQKQIDLYREQIKKDKKEFGF